MAADIDSGDEDVIAAINIIPFVDIVLVLLIIFMLTSAAIVRASIQVDLPSAASAGAAIETTLNIVYTIDRELFLDGEATDRDALTREIQTQVATDPKIQAVISADKALPYGDVVGVIDLVKKNGVKSFALNIERDAKPTETDEKSQGS